MKRILIGTDGSSAAENAAKFLAHLPHDGTIELTVLSVLFVPGTHKTYLVGDWQETCLKQERRSAEQAFARIESLFEGANVVLKHIVKEGHPGETIIAVARQVQPELLVIGATGHSAVARILLGSTSDYVATHAPCSVLVVRRSVELPKPHPLRVAIAYEPSAPAEAALEEFAEFTWGGEADVRVVAAVYKPGFYQGAEGTPNASFVEQAAERLHKVAPRATGVLIHSDHLGEGLVNYVESQAVDLVVVGETSRTRLGRILLGSITRFLLRHATCSVWITRNRILLAKKPGEVPIPLGQPLPLI